MVGLEAAICRDRVELANQISPAAKKESEPKEGPSRAGNGTGRRVGGILSRRRVRHSLGRDSAVQQAAGSRVCRALRGLAQLGEKVSEDGADMGAETLAGTG